MSAGAEAPLVGSRRRKTCCRSSAWLALLALLFLGVVAVIHWLVRPGSKPWRSTTTPPATTTPQLSFSLFCPDLSCGPHATKRWAVSPASLAGEVGDLSSAPGVADAAYASVAQEWQASPPVLWGAPVLLSEVGTFVRELLSGDPFLTGGTTVPYVDFGSQVGGAVVAISQRQLAFLVANALMGNTIEGGNGLSAAVQRCGLAGHTDFVYSLLSFLAVLSRELAGGKDGTLLVAATPQPGDMDWKELLGNKTLTRPRMCHKERGGPSNCTPDDFMTGGTAFQALTDIAGDNVGGGAQLCNIALSQDESLVQFYSELLAFAFFVQGDGSLQMLPTPFMLLGARRYLNIIGGEAMGQCGAIARSNWLNEDIGSTTVSVPIDGPGGATVLPVASSAIVAATSVCSAASGGCSIWDLRNNDCDKQRRHMDDDIGRWYQAFARSMYNGAIQEAVGQVVKSIGTGPWGSGVWFGDSQVYFLTMWLATNLLDGVGLDYYLYDRFCENPGNQCFVLDKQSCVDCLTRSRSNLDAARCGNRGAEDVISEFERRTAQDLYQRLAAVGGPPAQAFDLL